MMILGVDIGTTCMKMGVYHAEGGSLAETARFSRDYAIDTYNDGLFSDIQQEKWKDAFRLGCRELSSHVPDVDAISLSGTTPALTAMDRGGNALYPAILMLDQRSRAQARDIIETVGMEKLLTATGNMPVAGGCSLASILWIRDNHPGVFERTCKFGHSNTYIARWLTGEFAIDPSSASLTALYNTTVNDMTWNADIAQAVDLSLDLLPDLIPSCESAGRVLKSLAAELGLAKQPPVIIGGNDAVLAAYSAGIENPGDIINVNGTCEITLVCIPQCLCSTKYNVRAHVLPNRWLTLYVMNAGGKALEWFRNLYCREMQAEDFYGRYLPEAIEEWIDRESGVTYVPYLMGSRYSLQPLKAELLGLTHETSRKEILSAIVRGQCEYQREHLKEIALDVPLSRTIHITGGASPPAIIRAKQAWMKESDYIHTDQSSMRGAAMLGRDYLERRYNQS